MEMTVDEIIRYISRFPCKTVCITGGEPMTQKRELIRLLRELAKYNYFVHLCTNGTIWHDEIFELCDFISMDMKAPSSGERSDPTYLYWLDEANKKEQKFEVKVVIQDVRDLKYALRHIHPHLENTWLILQPCVEKGKNVADKEYRKLVGRLLKVRVNNVRILPQLHKILWGEGRRAR